MSLSVQHITFWNSFSHLVMVISWTGRGNKFKDVFLLSLKHVWSPSRASHYKSNISVPAEWPLWVGWKMQHCAVCRSSTCWCTCRHHEWLLRELSWKTVGWEFHGALDTIGHTVIRIIGLSLSPCHLFVRRPFKWIATHQHVPSLDQPTLPALVMMSPERNPIFSTTAATRFVLHWLRALCWKTSSWLMGQRESPLNLAE